MKAALEGLLIGAGIGVFLVLAEWYLLRKAAAERAERLHRKPELEDQDRRRIATMARFAAILPIGFALAYWIVWG